MPVLYQRADLDAFFAKLVQARECALLLDYDGTLAPFRVERDQAIPYPGVQAVLSQIMALGNTRLVIVSGRPANEVLSLLGMNHLQPEIWGCHGWERLWPDGSYDLVRPDKEEAFQSLTFAYGRLLALISGKFGRRFPMDKYVERKPVGVALHWRGCAPEVIAAFRDHIAEEWRAWLGGNTGLELCEFEEGLELRVPGRTKADVVETILKETGEDVAVTYLGDDQTDEDAFRALKGRGLTALVRPEVRQTVADLWIKPPDELIEFLRLWEDLRSRPGNGNL